MADTLTPAAEKILVAAEALFYARGITAVGVDLIAEHARVTKRTLYNQFGSKDRVIAAYLARRDTRWRDHVEAAAAVADKDEAILAPFTSLESWPRTDPRGCAFINALAELPDAQHPGNEASRAQKQWLLDFFASHARVLGVRRPRALAEQLFLIHEGALAAEGARQELHAQATATARFLVRAHVSGEILQA